jgi:MFS transporter, PPP family, 3-phenylpropionic acid transporter
MMARSLPALPRFLRLYVVLYAAFGTASPFLPAFLADRGVQPQAIGLVLAAGTAVRLVAGPVAGRTADRLEAPRAVLSFCAAAAALIAVGYLPAHTLWLLLLVSVAHAAVLAPLPPLSDALALGAAAPPGGTDATGPGFNYGWVRGAGSAAFILGSLLSGQLVELFGLGVIIWLNGALLAAAAVCATRVPDLLRQSAAVPVIRGKHEQSGTRTLLQLPLFRRLMLVAALVLGSHALHDSFVVIHWRAAGISPGTISVLWSESVAAEVVVFLFLGRPLLNAVGPAGASALAATAGVVRWAVLAQTTSAMAASLVEPLHGLTFALQHLASMRLLAEIVPPRLAATAQTLYATLGVGVTSALLTLASGPLYESLGAHAFWVMGVLCVAALPAVWRLRRRDDASLHVPPIGRIRRNVENR